MADANMDFARLEALVHTVGVSGPLQATEMSGGASTRRYFRVEMPTVEAPTRTAVAMFVPEGRKPEEVGKVPPGADSRWPFLEVRDILSAAGVDVPEIYAEDPEHGWILLEDLGEDTLANYLLRADSVEVRDRLYRKAVLDLARAQRALAKLPENSVIGTRVFDADLLRWEIEHFREWGLEARGHVLSPKDRETFDAIAERLANRIASFPRGFVHRDYQSRNLMVRRDESLCWIDFQDALLGPPVYDLVALLNDSYQTFDRTFVEARLRDYAEASNCGPLDELLIQFDYVTVQRKLKDAGRFVFIERKKQNAAFLRFVKPTIRKVGESLDRLAAGDADMRALKDLLKRAVPKDLL